jgi:vacuolar-type H+-ATPase subunit I/STV1
LILILAAGLGALAISQLVVGEKITTLSTTLASTQDDLTKTQQSLAKSEGQAKKAIAEKQSTQRELDEVKVDRDAKSARLDEQLKRANTLAANLEKTTGQLNDTTTELTAWNALGIPVDRIKQVLVDLDKAKAEKEGLVAENTVLGRKNRIMEAELMRYSGKSGDVQMTAGIKGKVLAVDPKYEFVVLDIGENQGVIQNGKLLVSREGKLVAKVQVVRVEANRSVANILAGWKQSDVAEGDQVLY